jgi:hypothetical protein
MKCANCAAPVPASVTAPDLRFCPHCHKRLLALGSPACNHCGLKLPDSYVRAKQAGLQRVNELAPSTEAPDTEKSVAEALGIAAASDRNDDSLEDLVTGLIRMIK